MSHWNDQRQGKKVERLQIANTAPTRTTTRFRSIYVKDLEKFVNCLFVRISQVVAWEDSASRANGTWQPSLTR
ncbi:hypothetical protein [Limosilactobacillus fermentum]